MKQRNSCKEASLFFGLTIGLTYLVFWGPLALFQVPTISFVDDTVGPGWALTLFMLGGFVPSLVAIALTWYQEGRSGLRRLGQRVIQFNIGWRWYAATLGIVVLSTVLQLTVIRLLGQSFDYALFLRQLGSFLPLIIVGPLSEELGWRGYALERVQTRWNPLISSLIIGVVWSFWHLPLFFMVGSSQHELHLPFLGFMVGITSISILFTWLYNSTNRSIWTAILFHWLYTYAAQVVSTGVSRSPLYNLLEYTPYLFITLIVLAIWRPWTSTISLGGPKDTKA